MVTLEVSSGEVLVHGGPPLPAALVRAALDWVDDPVGLLDGRPVPTPELWRSLIAAAVGECGDGGHGVVVVHPGDWPQHRVRLVRAAARSVTGRADVVDRGRRWPVRRLRRRWPVVAVAMVPVALVGVAMLTRGPGGSPPSRLPMAVSLVEGPMAVSIPPDWVVERRTSGPGSPRIRVVSPHDDQAAVNLTWSYAPQTTLADTAVALRRAAAEQPAGVFDFAAPGRPGRRPAVSYTETRARAVVRWSVLIDGTTRIAVGCQSAPGREDAVAAACAQAVDSAREAGTDPAPGASNP